MEETWMAKAEPDTLRTEECEACTHTPPPIITWKESRHSGSVSDMEGQSALRLCQPQG